MVEVSDSAYAAAVTMGGAILLGLGWELISLRSRAAATATATATPRSLVLIIGSIGLFVVLPACVADAVAESRHALIQNILLRNFSRSPFQGQFLDQIRVPFFGSLLALCLALAMISGGRFWRRSPGARFGRAGLLFATLVSLIVATYCHRVSAAIEEYVLRWPQVLDDGEASLGFGRLAILVAGVLIVGLGPSLDPRRREPAGRRAWLASVMVLAIGVVVFAQTRRFAHDTHLPAFGQAGYRLDDAPPLPHIYGCHDQFELARIWVVLSAKEARLGPTGGGSDPRTTAPIHQNISAEEALIKLRRQLSSTYRMYAPGWGWVEGNLGPIRITIEMDTPMPRIREWLRALDSVYRGLELRLLGRTVISYDTRTIGRFVRESSCSVNIELTDEGRPITELTDLQDLAHAASASRRTYRLRP